MSSPSTRIRPAAVAGSFYPQQPQALRGQIVQWLAAAGPTDAGAASPEAPAQREAVQPKILIAPHAGYVYSGEIAARAYALLAPFAQRITRVVLLGPAHRVALRGLAVPSVDAFWTPLGAVPLDAQGVAAAARLPQVAIDDAAHAWEHSLEVQLPFLQSVLPRFTLVPLVVGHASPRDVAQAIEALWGGDETVIVVSTDLSHYHDYEICRSIDRRTVASILAMDARLDHEQACGATPVNAALLCASRHDLTPRLLDLRNSGDTAGPRDRVVGYCSIAFEARVRNAH